MKYGMHSSILILSIMRFHRASKPHHPLSNFTEFDKIKSILTTHDRKIDSQSSSLCAFAEITSIHQLYLH